MASPSKPNSRSNKIYSSEQYISNTSGDHIMLNVVGNLTKDDNVFKNDLAVDEQIVQELGVDFKNKKQRSRFIYILLCLLTVGFYWLYINFCARCRKKVISVNRGRICVTNKGRMGVWKTENNGLESPGTCCCPGSRKLTSQTQITWYNISTIAHIEHVARNYIFRCFPFCCCPRKIWSSRLRIFFSTYPDQGLKNAYDIVEPVAQTVWMAPALDTRTISSYFSLSYYFNSLVLGAMNVGKTAFSVVSNLHFDDSLMLEIEVTNRDRVHSEGQVVHDALVGLQNTMLSFKNEKITIVAPPATENLNLVENSAVVSLFDNVGKVNLKHKSIPWLPSEEIVAVLPFFHFWTVTEIFLTIITLGLYWLLVVRQRHAMKSVLIMTRTRLISLVIDSRDGVTDRYRCVRSWFIAGLQTGLFCRENEFMWTSFQTQYGALTIQPTLSSRHWWHLKLYGLDPVEHERGKKFLLTFSGTDVPKVYNPRHNIPVPPTLSTVVLPSEGESIVAQMDSSGSYHKGCVACCPKSIGSLLTCGILPYKLHQEVFLTTHRIWALARPLNQPFFLRSIFSPPFHFLLWSPLVGTEFVGHRVAGQVDVLDSCPTRECSCLPCCIPVHASSKFSFGFAFDASHKGFPLTIENYEKKTGRGLLLEPKVTLMRSALGALLAAKGEMGEAAARQAVTTTQPSAISPFVVNMPPSYDEALNHGLKGTTQRTAEMEAYPSAPPMSHPVEKS